MTSYIIEGIDSLGKSTLIEAIINEVGYMPVIHYSKPKSLKFSNGSLEKYQRQSFINGFQLLTSKVPIIFDRFTIGEYIYAPLYRGYSGTYIFDFEKDYEADKMDHTKLILLTTSNWTFAKDDGESFDFSRKEEEQELFKVAFNKSIFPNKILIDINDNGTRKTIDQLLGEIL